MENKELHLGDFKREGMQGSFGHYFSAKVEDMEVCLESCLSGYCVGIYKDQELISPKECTDIPNMLDLQIAPGFSMGTGEALEKALKIANRKIKAI